MIKAMITAEIVVTKPGNGSHSNSTNAGSDYNNRQKNNKFDSEHN